MRIFAAWSLHLKEAERPDLATEDRLSRLAFAESITNPGRQTFAQRLGDWLAHPHQSIEIQ
jgi:hypothetical protein